MADPWDVVIVIDGQTVTALGRLGSLLITDELNDAPNSATLTTTATPTRPPTAPFAPWAFDAGAFQTTATPWPRVIPHPGSRVAVYLGTVDPAALLFGGEVVVLDQFYEADRPEHVAYHLSCTDFTRRGNRKQVVKQYAQQSATAIALDLVAGYTDLTANHVQAGLPTVEGGIALTFEDVSRALSRVAEQIGASWYWDYVGDLHFFLDEAGPAPAPIVPGGAPFGEFRIVTDITQVRTRVIVEGMGSVVLADVAAGATVIPIADASMFPSAGDAKLGPTPQQVSYTSVVLGGPVGVAMGQVQPGIPGLTAVQAAGASGDLTGGPYYWLWTAVQGKDESNWLGFSAAVTIAPVTPPITGGTIQQDNSVSGQLLAQGQSYYWWITFVTADGGETTPAAIGSRSFSAVARPGSIYSGGSATTGGSIAPGTYRYYLSYVAPGYGGGMIETAVADPGAASFTVTAPNNAISLTGLAVSSDGRVKAKRLYRSDSGFSAARFVAEIGPGVTAYLDTTPQSSLSGSTPPSSDTGTFLAAANISLKVSTDPRVTGRRLYRAATNSDPNASQMVVDIRNNTDLSTVDTGQSGTGQRPPTAATATGGAVDVTVPAGPAGTSSRRIYRSKDGAYYYLVTTIGGNTAATYRDGKADAVLGPMYVDASSWPTPAGSTALPVNDLAAFPASGYLRIANQTIYYSGRSGTSGPGNLTGIPSTGRGAIVSPIAAGASASVAPQLLGVAGLVANLNVGDECYLLVIENDAAAQAAIAALEGGDGIIEHYLQDRRLSAAGARARARADLELFKAVETKVSYVTWDPLTRSGKTVHVDLPAPTNLTGDFLIQSVTIDNVDMFTAGPTARLYPRRRVVASSTRFTFDNVLQRLLMEDT